MAIDHHGYRTAKDEPDLLVLVLVLGNLDIGIDVDEADAEPVAVHRPRKHPVPDPRGPQFRDRLINVHRAPPLLRPPPRPSPASAGGRFLRASLASGGGSFRLLRDAIFVPTSLIFLRRSAGERTSTASPHPRIQGVISSVPVTVTVMLTEPLGPSPSFCDGCQMDSLRRAAAGGKKRRRTSTGSPEWKIPQAPARYLLTSNSPGI